MNSQFQLKCYHLSFVGVFLFSLAMLSPLTSLIAKTKLIGHRGASGSAPENTLASIREAWRLDADGVEIDVRLSRDNKVVVIHDDTLQRTAGMNLSVRSTDHHVLRKYDVGSWKSDDKFSGEKIPLLSEVLKGLPEGKELYIEFKDGGHQLVDEVLRLISYFPGKTKQITFIGFDFSQINYAKSKLNQISAFYLVSDQPSSSEVAVRSIPELDKVIKMAHRHNINGISFIYSGFITENLVRRMKAEKLDLAVWTSSKVDKKINLDACDNLGVLSYTGNYPDRNFPEFR